MQVRFSLEPLKGTNSLRNILKAMADQWGEREIVLGGFVL